MMSYITFTGEQPNTPEHNELTYSLVEVNSCTGIPDAIWGYGIPPGKPSDMPELEYLRRPGKHGPIPGIMGEDHHNITHSKNDMEKIFKDQKTRDVAFRVHDAGDHLFLVVEHCSDQVLLRRVAYDDSVNLELEQKIKKHVQSQEDIDEYKALLEEYLRKKKHFGWICAEVYRCNQHPRPYMLVPCLAEELTLTFATLTDVSGPQVTESGLEEDLVVYGSTEHCAL
jgi:hypothetical protein